VWALISGALLLATVLPNPAPARASDTVTRWEHFSESSGCGDPYTKPPYVTKSGLLGNSEAILGPYGSYFGRSVSEIAARVGWWTVPFSGGRRVLVHQAALPAFNRVSAGLAAEAAKNRVYPITTVSAFYPRTVSGSHQLSRHALGVAIDMNYSQNPYRADGKLITNMPQWFVDVWRDAGFCWGGDWMSTKDPMHFSWMGPGAGDGASPPLDPISPKTARRDYGSADATWSTVFGPVVGRYALTIADGTGNGAPDVVGLRPHPDGAVLDIASASETYGSCSVGRWFVPDATFLGADHTLLMDADGDSRQDLVTVDVEQSEVVVGVATRRGNYRDSRRETSALSTDLTTVAGADFDGDHLADLWSVAGDGTLSVYGGEDWSNLLHTGTLPSGAPALIAAADRDGGDTPEIFALYPRPAGSRLEILRLGSSWAVEQSLTLSGDVSTYLALGAGDYDGDGRADVQTLDSQGRLKAHIGNTSTGRAATSWFADPTPDCQDPIVLSFEGSFFDDETSVHRNGIEAMAASGITQGCNPPFNDRFCPDSILTRAQAATFVARALGLPPSAKDYFIDDDGHVLEGGINRIAAAGITVGCNQAGTEFCPDRQMTRAEFAAFVTRALKLQLSAKDYFIDDSGHVLEGAINRLAAAGITKGCNPPANDHFCPNAPLTRAETATFLTRAFS
jgi:hypothetical protein